MEKTIISQNGEVVRRQKTSMSDSTKTKLNRRVSFDPLALLLDASLEGELELVQKTASQVRAILFGSLFIQCINFDAPIYNRIEPFHVYCYKQVPNPSAANDEGITALHNAICAGHFDIVK